MRWISIVRSLYLRILASFLITFLSPEIAASINIHVPFSLSCIVVGDGSVSLCLLIPQYGYLASSICFYWFWNMFIPVFFVQLHPCFLAYVEVLYTHSIISFYVLFFCQYWACWYYVVYCLVKLLAKSALAICLCVQYFCCVIFCL